LAVRKTRATVKEVISVSFWTAYLAAKTGIDFLGAKLRILLVSFSGLCCDPEAVQPGGVEVNVLAGFHLPFSC